jgi:hypothetical protein
VFSSKIGLPVGGPLSKNGTINNIILYNARGILFLDDSNHTGHQQGALSCWKTQSYLLQINKIELNLHCFLYKYTNHTRFFQYHKIPISGKILKVTAERDVPVFSNDDTGIITNEDDIIV